MSGEGWVQRRPDITTTEALKLGLREVADPELVQEFIRPAVDNWQRGDLAATESVLYRAAASDDVGLQAIAQLLLADVLRVRGNVEDALITLNIVASSSHGVLAPLASCILGDMYEEYGDLVAAESAYRRAADASNAEFAARGRTYLAELLYFDGRVEEATRLLAEAVSSGVREWSARAAGLLGDIWFAEGRLDAAYDVYSKAAALDSADVADRAVVMLTLLVDIGHRGANAVEAYAALKSNDSSSQRRAYIEYNLLRWRNYGSAELENALRNVDPAWTARYESARRYYEDHLSTL